MIGSKRYLARTLENETRYFIIFHQYGELSMRKILLTTGCMLALLMAMLPAQMSAQGNIDWEEIGRAHV
mgnify:CR=1 FL=1